MKFVDSDIEMSTAGESIYKVTLYMTPCQWNRLSAWSALHPEDSWIMLLHESDARVDYEEERKRIVTLDVPCISDA
jgi:hypothetical protein